MNARSLVSGVVGLVCVLSGIFALGSAPALALFTHPYLSRLTGTPSGSFDKLCGVAVDPASQDVYVSDYGNHAIDVFSSSGVYQSRITGMSVLAGSFSEPCSVAVSDVTDVYVADSGQDLFARHCGAPLFFAVVGSTPAAVLLTPRIEECCPGFPRLTSRGRWSGSCVRVSVRRGRRAEHS